MCPLMRANWRHLANTIELMLPSAHPNPHQNGKSISSAVFAQLTAESPDTLQWAPLSPKIVHSYGRIWTPSNLLFIGPIRTHNPNGISIGSGVFAQMTVECPYTLQRDAPSKKCPFPWRIWAPCNTWFPGLTRVLSPNGTDPFLQGSLV